MINVSSAVLRVHTFEVRPRAHTESGQLYPDVAMDVWIQKTTNAQWDIVGPGSGPARHQGRA
eukprot:7445048-Pyramimonas_sp.AAC.1